MTAAATSKESISTILCVFVKNTLTRDLKHVDLDPFHKFHRLVLDWKKNRENYALVCHRHL